MAGVSEATVSRVMSGSGLVKEETKRRVLQAAKRLNYYPNAIARSFARGRSGNLGVILPFVPKVHLFSTYYFSEILSGIGKKVQEYGYNLLLLFRSPEETMDFTHIYRTQKADACIILGARDVPEERRALRELSEQSLPFCLVNQRFSGSEFNEVDADHVHGSYEAVRHLIDRGYRSIAFLNGPLHYSNSADRLQGYKKALAEAGLPYAEELVFMGNYSRKSGYEASRFIYARRNEIDAVFAANDRMAIGLMQGLREYGVRAGEHIAVVGYDDSDGSKITDPPLTTVHVPFYEMGMAAAGIVLAQADGEQASGVKHVLPTSLVVRESSGPRINGRADRTAAAGPER